MKKLLLSTMLLATATGAMASGVSHHSKPSELSYHYSHQGPTAEGLWKYIVKGVSGK